MTLPLVSIAMPIYNVEGTLRRAINSIIGQSYTNWELIIVDDGSTDGSLAIAKSFTDSRIRIFSDGVNKGISFRLNQAIDTARGSYFARMDGDDISFPKRIERQVEFLNSNKQIDLLGSNIVIFKGNGCLQGILPIKQIHEEICRSPFAGLYLPHPTWMGKIEWFKKYRYQSSSDRAEDQSLLLRSYKYSKFACLPEVLLGYRQENRSFKKMLLSRTVYLKTCLEEANRSKSFILEVQLLIFYLVKVISDLLNIKLGLKRFRNQLLPVSNELSTKWSSLWDAMSK